MSWRSNRGVSPVRARRGPVPRVWVIALLLILVALGACGRRTAPVPLGRILPVPGGLAAWQREARVMVSWRLPAEAVSERQGGLEGFVLWLERLPLNCDACPPDQSRELALPLHVESLVMEAGRAIYGFPVPGRPVTWRIRVAARLGRGRGRFSAPVVLDTPASLPVHRLQMAPAQTGDGAKSVRLYWLPRRERVVKTLTEQGAMVAQDQFFRANLFRRDGKAPWPVLPLNIRPLETGQIVAQIPIDKTVEFKLRLVDRFGNEGPASPTLAIGAGANGR